MSQSTAFMGTSGLVIIFAVVLIVLIAGYIIATYNKLIRYRANVEEGFATMDVFLKKRWDMVPNLVETVKGYAKHESETLSNIIGLRSGGYSNMSMEEKIKSNSEISREMPKIFALSEAYPELKASENFLNLSNQLNRVEEDIANARKYYNAVVKKYNILVETFPSSLIAGMFHFKRQQMFNIDEASRENVEVKF